MEKGVRLASLVPFLVIAAAIAVLLIAPAALAQEKRETLKELAQEKRAVVQEKTLEIREAVKEKVAEKVGEKKENVREAAQEKREASKERVQEKREHSREVLKDKRETLRTKVADANAGKVKALDRARLKEIADLNPEQAKERLAKLKVVKADENFKVRPIAEAAKEARKKAFERLKEDEKTLKEGYKERLDSLKEAKERLRNCGNETQSDDCAKARTGAVERAKEAALKAVDRLVTHLQKLKEKLQSSENIPEAEAAERIAKIDALLSEVDAIKQKISAATTKEEINAAVKELKDAVKKVKRASEAHSQGLLRAEINGVIHRAEVAEKKLDCALDSLEANGTDTSAIDAKIAEFSSKMGAAREKLNAAKELLGSDNETKIAEGKTLVREARDLVQEAHRLLEDIRKDIRELGGKPCEEEQEITVEENEAPETSASAETPTTT
ncbi:hypothetical protein HYV83_02975 [Candidatus Woesearchaeota archaeon]|nr:hypothetical protein [Candidatus Woesearchaeota archaeon]